MRSSKPKMLRDYDDLSPDGGFKIRIYEPTLEEMKDFSGYIKHIHETGGHRAGLVKVIPPKEYKPRKAGYGDEKLYDMIIPSPIRQEVNGEKGLYQQINLVHKSKLTVREYKKLAESKYGTPEHGSPEELERCFWKNIFTKPSIYGADVSATLYDEDVEEFNMTKLNTILDDIRQDYSVTIEGVNTAYLYFGMWKTSFCWHTEDMDLYSINYLHHGAPKAWYSIAPEHGKRFERLAASFFPYSFNTCRAFLRHKTTLISPQVLKKYSIPFSKCTQNEGEFMITFPYSYHSGYNHGFNIAEATNFASDYWINFGKWATKCDCTPESVKISMQLYVKKYQPDRYEKWLKGQDIGEDPRDPKHVGAAPKPSPSDLVLSEPDLDENQSSNVKVKTKAARKAYPTIEESYKRYNEIFLQKPEIRSGISELPHWNAIPAEMITISNHTLLPDNLNVDFKTIANCTVDGSIEARPNYESYTEDLTKKRLKESKDVIKSKKRYKEPQIISRELLQFLPQTFTHEKRFNRCIAAAPPHCSVCQLFESHPKDDANIWDLQDINLPKSCPILLPRNVFNRYPIEQRETPQPTRRNSDKMSSSNGDLEFHDQIADKNRFSFLDIDLDDAPLLQCIVCMLCVHTTCYGLDNSTKKEDWVCDRCVAPNRNLINCELCPCRGGALKTINKNWMHITCALTLPETKFIDLISPVAGKERQFRMPSNFETNPCTYCSKNFGLTKYVRGHCLTCDGFWPDLKNYHACETKFHPTCGLRNGIRYFYFDMHREPATAFPIRASCPDCSKERLKDLEVSEQEVDEK